MYNATQTNNFVTRPDSSEEITIRDEVIVIDENDVEATETTLFLGMSQID